MAQGESVAYDERTVGDSWGLGEYPRLRVEKGGRTQGRLCPESQRSREGLTEGKLEKDPWDLARRQWLVT